ncbi:Flp pilus assembly protein CpaB [Kordiimonas gwangyangensis]|uniref:Flp pilus assembly protein CpaB n=1 Tax=Kordiimonas gwangyangensis TaxID=288022 RepID=UPI0003789870|nr:Flp pilus assembly protein CpaB [Kordiimonas gwangyangensis]
MNPRSLILIVLAAVGVLAVVMLTRSYLGGLERQQGAEVAVKRIESGKVMVAARTLSVGTILKPEDVRWQAWPEDGINEAYFSSHKVGDEAPATPKGLAGKVVRTPLAAGEPVTRASLVSQGERGFLAAILSPGMRAVTVQLSPTSGLGGFVFPGDRVDVILNHTIEKSREEKYNLAETVFQNVRVLGVDQKSDTVAGEVRIAKTATLEVTPKMAEKMVMLDSIGNLSLILRSLSASGDGMTADPDSPPVGETSSHTTANEISKFLPALGKKESDGPTVRVTRGGESTFVAVEEIEKDGKK